MSGQKRNLSVGDRVFDREKEAGGMVVVRIPDKNANEIRVPGTGKTVADYNDDYPDDANVATVVFEKDIYGKVNNVDALTPDEIQEEVERISIREYDYPIPRLRRRLSSLPDKIETYHDLICYQHARLIKLAAGVTQLDFLWTRYNQLKEGEFEMASITKEDKYQLQEGTNICVYCGQEAETQLDHVIPISRGGPDDISNQVPACEPCNSSKLDNDVIEWCQEEGIPIPRIVSGKYLKQYEENLRSENRLHEQLPHEEREKWDGAELKRNVSERVFKSYRGQ